MGEFSNFALVPEQGVVPQMEQLSEEMRARISAMAARLNVYDSAAVLGFGAQVQKEMNAFTDVALGQMLSGDAGALEDTLQELAAQIRSCSFASGAKSFLGRLFGGGASSLKDVRALYEKAEPRIGACADQMVDRRVALMRDSALLERIYDRNESMYRELCSLIVVGDEAARQAKARGEDAEILARLERRVQDLRVTQLASTQLAAQIRMVQKSDDLTCERLKTALEVTIPLWKSQMAAALGLARATDALDMHRRFEKTAERGMRSGAKELRAQTAAYGKASTDNDREQAEKTAQALLAELEEIERGLKEKAAQGLGGSR